MFNRVLVGVDGRASGRDAIALARALAGSPGRLVLAHVHGAQPSRGRFGTSDSRAQAHHLVTSVRVENGLTCPTVVARNGSPAAGLHRLVEQEGADLLVVGSSHRGPLGRVLLGDDSLAALVAARCAVAVAPRGYVFASPAWRAVGVGDDGSSGSVRALQVASDIASEHDAQVQILSPMAAQPEERLLRFSRGVDLLVVSSPGDGLLGRRVRTSAWTHLARHSACPLLVVPRQVSATERSESGAPSPDPRVLVGPAS